MADSFQFGLRKAVWTLATDNYFPELCDISLPNHAAFAEKIGAEFHVISERAFPEWYATYEKVQIFERGKGYDWNIHIDADLLVSPDMPDPTLNNQGQVGWYSIYDAALYFKADRFFSRDGRRTGICSAFLAVPYLCHDIWEPFSCGYEEALKGINKPHGIDDYCFSRNFAKYGLRGDWVCSSEHVHHVGLGGNTKDFVALERAKDWLAKK
jgi:hypothetical protein